MGEFSEFDSPPAPAPSASHDFAEFDAPPAGAAPMPAIPTRSFLQRAGDTIASGAKAVGHIAADQAQFGFRALTDPAGTFGTPDARKQAAEDFALTNPSKRREYERGLGDVVTLGYGNKLAEKVDKATGENKLTPEQQAKDATAAPDYRTGGQIVGSLLPNPVSEAVGIGAKAVGAAAPEAASAVRSFLSKSPVLGGAAKSVANYEATAPLAAAASAGASGHRLDAAREAATDPAGLALSATAGAIPGVLQRAAGKLEPGITDVEAAAKKRAVKDLGTDITSHEGIKARDTDAKRTAAVNDRLFALAQERPELRQAFGESAEKALPKIQAFKKAIAEPLARIDEALDADTGGGIDLKTAVDSMRQQALELRKALPEGNSRIADLIDKKADSFEENYSKYGGGHAAEPPPEVAKALETGVKPREWTEAEWEEAEREWNGQKGHKTVGEKTNQGARGSSESPPDLDQAIADLEKARKNAVGVAAKGIDDQIAKFRAEKGAGPAPAPAARGVVIPVRQFRQEVTELLKHADSSMGEIEGTQRHALLSKLYDVGKRVIDDHIDGSGVPQQMKDQLRKINDQYFLASRAEAAIESRGYKEANRPGFKLAHTAHQALHSATGGAGLAAAAGYAAMNPHSIPYMAAALTASKILPAAAKSANWWAANGGYRRAIENLAKVAARARSASDFVSEAAGAGLGAEAARRIYEAAHPRQPAQVSP